MKTKLILAVTLCVIGGVAAVGAQGSTPAFLAMEAAPTAQLPAPQPAPPPARPMLPRLTGLSAVLVTGDTDEVPARAGVTKLEVPAAARKALLSITSFLPYKTYSMADAALVSTAEYGSMSTVTMRDPELTNTLFHLVLTPFLPRASESDGYRVTVSLQESSLGRPDAKSSTLISTGVSVAPGETVVVGTSRVGGGRKAYVLLLTALSK